MPQALVTVRAVVREVRPQGALVEVQDKGCGRCHEQGGCGGQSLTQMFCGGQKRYWAESALPLAPGDRVNVAVPAGTLVLTANLAYGVPLTVTILSAFVGQALAGELGAILGAGFGFVSAFAGVAWYSRQGLGKKSARPHIVSLS